MAGFHGMGQNAAGPIVFKLVLRYAWNLGPGAAMS